MAILSEQSMACVTLNFRDKGGRIFCYTSVVILQLLYNQLDSSRSLIGWHLSPIRDIGKLARLPPFFFWLNAMYSLLCAKEITKKTKFKTRSISDYKLIKRGTNLELWNFVLGKDVTKENLIPRVSGMLSKMAIWKPLPKRTKEVWRQKWETRLYRVCVLSLNKK